MGKPMQQAAISQTASGEPPRYTQDQLNQFISAHERYHRRDTRGRRAMMPFLQAQGMDLARRILAEADFTGADFSGAHMALANFERASLYCADLRGIDGRGANFLQADLRGCSLREASLSGAVLDEADLREALLARADLGKGFKIYGRETGERAMDGVFAVDFSNCSMKKVKLRKAKLRGANFSGAILRGADLEGAVLEDCNFEGAVLVGANLTRTRVDRDALVNCVIDPSPAAMERADELRERLYVARRWVETNGAEGRPANLDGEDLRTLGSMFEGARLTALSATGACGVSVNFRDAALQGANFEGADLRDAHFAGADLRGANFRGANILHANFRGADVRPLSLNNGVRPVDLTDALHVEDVFAFANKGGPRAATV